ncbi:hypothetical protein AAG570_010758 [Ranatra chinensis]|uniref:Uncharacterized protein n=1 Tax=Ranatra chinensis TaxID=642074 RepID=A0ABD0YNH8_9HEMI
MMRMGSASQLGDIRRLSKGLRSSKKSILYSDYYEDEPKEHKTLSAQRSVSLGRVIDPRGVDGMGLALSTRVCGSAAVCRRFELVLWAVLRGSPKGIVPTNGKVSH